MKRLRLRSIRSALAAGVLCPWAMSAALPAIDPSLLVFIGTYTGARSKGIYVSRFDSAHGQLSTPELAIETASPSFLARHPNGRFLYAVGETSNFGGKGTGAVSAFGLDPKTGKLTLLNQQSSGGGGPCHLAVDRAGKCVLVANYGTGSIALMPIREDGSLREPSAVIQHQGSSINRDRQAGPHAHFITPDPANRFVLACDLGLDKVLVYRLDPDVGSLAQNDPPGFAAAPGSGPRHLVFHPNGTFVYLINELSSTLTALRYDPQRGTLRELQSLSTLPMDAKGINTCAEVQVHPSGKFVYGSNRGHNSIAVFAVEPKTGHLSWVECQSTRGKNPRHFALDPSGNWLLAENQDSDSVVVFRVDPRSGRLSATTEKIEVGAPVCLEFAPIP